MKERISDIPSVISQDLAAIRIDPTDDEAILAGAKAELVKMLCNAHLPANLKVNVIRELLDRIEGKAIQRTDARIAVAEVPKKLIEISFVESISGNGEE